MYSSRSSGHGWHDQSPNAVVCEYRIDEVDRLLFWYVACSSWDGQLTGLLRIRDIPSIDIFDGDDVAATYLAVIDYCGLNSVHLRLVMARACETESAHVEVICKKITFSGIVSDMV